MNTKYSLWMGDIEPWMDELFIMNAFIEHGFRPQSIKLIRNKGHNKLSKYCFVNFNCFKEASNALFKLNAKKISNTNIYFKLNIAKYNNIFSKNIYVGNLPPKINDNELFNIFKSKYQSVYLASVITDNGISRGYGFVHFGNEKEYEKCLKEMNGTFIDNKIIRVKGKKNEEGKELFYEKKFKENILKEKIGEENYSSDNEETTYTQQERENDLSPYDAGNSYNMKFINNLKLLESNDIISINNKIKEKVDGLLNYYITNKIDCEIPQILYYYSSYNLESKKSTY